MADIDTLRSRLEQTKKRADMQISGHNFLAGSLGGRARVCTLVVIISALFLLMFAWVQESWLVTLAALVGIKLTGDVIKFALGVAAFLNLSLVIWDLVDEPRIRAELHRKAVGHYTKVKHHIQRVLESDTEISDQLYQELIDEYLNCPTHLEDGDFLRLKRHHLVKKNLSKLLDTRPHAWLPWLSLQYWWRDTFTALPPDEKQVDAIAPMLTNSEKPEELSPNLVVQTRGDAQP